MGKPGKSYNDLELVEGDIDMDSNEQNDAPLDPRAGNVNIEIPRIKFNPKDVAKILNKYVTDVDCTKKCLIEITKLLKWYNRLGEGVLPYKPKDLKLNSQVLKRKKKKHLSKMVKEGVKKLQIVDSKIKKSGRGIIDDHKSLKELDKMGEIIVEHGKIGKSVWKVRKFEESNLLKENFSLNGSWTVNEEIINDDAKKSVCVADDDEPPLLVPAGFSVLSDNSNEVQNSEKISTPSLKSLTDRSPKNNSSNKRKSPKSKMIDESINKSNIRKSKSPVTKNVSSIISNESSIVVNNTHNNSWLVSESEKEDVNKALTNQCPESSTTPNTSMNTKNIKKYISPNVKNTSLVNINNSTPNNGVKSQFDFQSTVRDKQQSPGNDLVMSKIKRRSNEINLSSSSLNESWSVCNDEKQNLSKRKSLKPKISVESSKYVSPSTKNCSPKISGNTSNNWSVSGDNNGSASKKIKKSLEPVKIEKRSSLTSVITPDKSSKSPKSPKSPTPEQRVLRRRTIIIPKKKPEGPNEGTPKRKVKENSVTKALPKRRKTLAGEQISMLNIEEISNKALEKVVSS